MTAYLLFHFFENISVSNTRMGTLFRTGQFLSLYCGEFKSRLTLSIFELILILLVLIEPSMVRNDSKSTIDVILGVKPCENDGETM